VFGPAPMRIARPEGGIMVYDIVCSGYGVYGTNYSRMRVLNWYTIC